jgi:hypothetical protein
MVRNSRADDADPKRASVDSLSRRGRVRAARIDRVGPVGSGHLAEALDPSGSIR